MPGIRIKKQEFDINKPLVANKQITISGKKYDSGNLIDTNGISARKLRIMWESRRVKHVGESGHREKAVRVNHNKKDESQNINLAMEQDVENGNLESETHSDNAIVKKPGKPKKKG